MKISPSPLSPPLTGGDRGEGDIFIFFCEPMAHVASRESENPVLLLGYGCRIKSGMTKKTNKGGFTMKQNMGTIDRAVRTVLAIIAIILFVTDQITGTAATVILVMAIIFLVTSVIGFCPVYVPFKISTNKKE